MKPEVKIRYVTVCHGCGHRDVETVHETVGVEYSAPTLPSRCDGCGEKLRRGPREMWHRTHYLEEVV